MILPGVKGRRALLLRNGNIFSMFSISEEAKKSLRTTRQAVARDKSELLINEIEVMQGLQDVLVSKNNCTIRNATKGLFKSMEQEIGKMIFTGVWLDCNKCFPIKIVCGWGVLNG